MSQGADQTTEHHQGATNTYGFGPHYHNEYRHRAMRWASCIWMSIFGVFALIAAILSIRFGLAAGSPISDNYSPNETRLISTVSSVSCEYVSVDTALVIQTGEMYLLSEKPSLTDHDSFQFDASEFFSTKDNYHNWNWHLYKDSTIKFSACKDNIQSSFQYYIIKGTAGFNKWVANPSTAYAVDSGSVPMSSVCDNAPKTSYTYSVPKEDDYYVVFRKVPGTANDFLEIDFDVYRTKYAVNPDKIISSVPLLDFGGVLEIPLSARIFVLVALRVDSPLDVDWTSTVFMKSNCVVRTWIYIVIPLACISSFGLILACVMVCICCCCRNKKYTPLREDTSLAPVVDNGPPPTTATYITGTTAPPEPSYEACPQSTTKPDVFYS